MAAPKGTSIDLRSLDPAERYRLLAATVVPRPIALVTSRSDDRRVNAAPFSFFNVLCPDPAILALGIENRSDGVAKDTKMNLRVTGEFIVNLVSEDMAAGMNICAIDFPSGINELEEAGFGTTSGDLVDAPRILESPVSFECQLVSELRFGANASNSVFLGEALRIHFNDGILAGENAVDTSRLSLIGRLAGSCYVRLSDRFSLPRS